MQLSEEITRQTIKEINATSIKDIGIIIKSLVPKVNDKADGIMVNNAVQRF